MPGSRYIGPRTCWNWPCTVDPVIPAGNYVLVYLGALIAAGLACHLLTFLLRRQTVPAWALPLPIAAFLLAIVPLWRIFIHF
jgi:hypothetical protein